jgi:hypothetical protein
MAPLALAAIDKVITVAPEPAPRPKKHRLFGN